MKMGMWIERAGRALSIAIVIYLLLWLACILWFWLGIPFSGGGIFAYTLLVYYITLPAASAVVCSLAGWRTEAGKVRLLAPLAGALLYVAALLLTFSLSSALGLANIAPVGLAAFLAGLAPGMIGFACGWALRRLRDSRR
ncbi:hypothetical protein [Collinsella tanakaei]|uniref:hypothetical protein n=1 Tax=Collinsella tanakaei TaxID=626935 RepID=UPI0025A3DEFE|nr:hypothetical protein [Collinsella tanakaei]MDM8299980.1 hypothetical protein [Collinsella tanakaei]